MCPATLALQKGHRTLSHNQHNETTPDITKQKLRVTWPGRAGTPGLGTFTRHTKSTKLTKLSTIMNRNTHTFHCCLVRPSHVMFFIVLWQVYLTKMLLKDQLGKY